MNERALIALLYLLMSTACVGISAYSTYEGTRSILGPMAIPITFVIGAGLFVCNILLLRARQRGNSLWGPALGLIAFALMSSASNFTYFYSLAMIDQIPTARLTAAEDRFDRNMRLGENEITISDGVEAKRSNVEQELRRLRQQVGDPLNPGFGEEAQRHLRRVYQLMDGRLTNYRLPPVDSSRAVNDNWLDGFERVVRDELGRWAEADPMAGTHLLIGRARTRHDELTQPLDRSAAIPAPQAKLIIDELGVLTEDVERAVIQARRLTEPDFTLQLQPVSSDGIGLFHIPDVFRSALEDRVNDAMTILTAFLGLFIDLIPLLIVLLIRSGLQGAEPRKRPAFGGRKPVVLGDE